MFLKIIEVKPVELADAAENCEVYEKFFGLLFLWLCMEKEMPRRCYFCFLERSQSGERRTRLLA